MIEVLQVPDAGAGANRAADGPAVQDDHSVCGGRREGGGKRDVGTVQGAVCVRVPEHQPDQDREPAATQPARQGGSGRRRRRQAV